MRCSSIRVYDRDFNFIFPWDSYCEAELFYTTPLNAETFTQKVNQALPELRDTGRKSYDNALFFDIGITASDSNGDTIKHGLEPFMARYYWSLPDRDLGSISLLETANMNVNLAYNGHKLRDNIVEIHPQIRRQISDLGELPTLDGGTGAVVQMTFTPCAA